MKNFLRFFVFLFCFSFFGCLGIIDESLISSVSFEITIPKSIEKQSTSARTATTDNFKLIVDLETKDSEEVRTEEKNVSEGETVSISFEEIPVKSEIRLVGKLFDSESNVLYSGESEWVVIQSGKNEVNLVMKKKILVDAAEPTEVMDLTSTVFVKDSDVTSTTLQCSGMSTDEGVITFQWQVQNANGEWENLEARENQQSLNLYISILDVFATDFEVNEVKNYRCIVTNTNDKVKGNKTASVTKTATIAYVEGILSSMTAEYKKGCYEIFGTAFTYENIIVKEKWISGENSFEFTVPASNTRYEVKQNSTTAGGSVIGAVPYTITYKGVNAEAPLSQELTIPVKYLLKTADLQLSSLFNDSYVSTSEDDKTLKVPQYGTVKYGLTLPVFVGGSLTITKADGTTEPITDLTNSGDYYSTTIYKDGTLIENDASCEVAGEYKYKLAIKSENEWFVCEENSTKEFDVEVYEWEMNVEVSFVNPSNTDETIVATQNASGNYVVPNTVQRCAVSAKTNIDGISPINLSLETDGMPNTSEYFPTNTIITVKFGDNIIGTVTVISATVGSEDFPVTDWTVLTSLVDPDEVTDEPITIYVSGTITATNQTAFINRPVTIIPKGEVTIIRENDNNISYLFSVLKNFTVQADSSNIVILDGGSSENSNPLIYCVSDDVVVNLACCKLQNANCGVSVYGSVLYAGNGASVIMNNCIVSDNIGIAMVLSNTGENSFANCNFSNNEAKNSVIYASSIFVDGEETTSLTLENCTFETNTLINPNSDGFYFSDLGIENANTITLKGCEFTSYTTENYYNIYSYTCSTLNIDGSTKIPKLFFYNSFSDAKMNIVVGDSFALAENNTPISIRAYYCDATGLGIDDLDLDICDSDIPIDKFILENEGYKLGSDGVISSSN